MLKNRISNYFKINTALSSLSNKELQELLKGNLIGEGWGKNHVAKVEKTKVFVKSIPLTDLELENSFSTKNIFNLPMYYNYGVGSAGFGVFRELNLHVKTTNWVLAGESSGFPLMYHYRIVKKASKPKKMNQKAMESHRRYVKYWNSSKEINKYVLERKRSEYEVIVFLEYIPHVYIDWLKQNVGKINIMNKKMFEVIDFLKGKGIIHFDAHFGNILTDGEEVYLSDFGLGLDKNFDLSAKEKSFFIEHQNYDYAEYLGCCSGILESEWHDLSSKTKKILEERFGIAEETSYIEKINLMLDHLPEVSKVMKLNPLYVKFLEKNFNVIRLSNDFFFGLRKDSSKKLKYPAKRLSRELRKLGII